MIIRDDDLSYFTRPEELSRLYDGIWEYTPVHFSVIPYVYTRQRETPAAVAATKDNYWVGENKALVAFLKRKIKEGKAVIWQHGFTHRNYGTRFELERTDRRLIAEELRRGKEHLERTFGVKVDTLVAPHDRFSKGAVLAAEDVGFTTISRCYAPLPREIRWTSLRYLRSYARLVLFWLRRGRRWRYPRLLDFGGHTELFSYRIEELDTQKIEKIVSFIGSADGLLCLTAHYRTMSMRQRELLLLLLKRVGPSARGSRKAKAAPSV